MVKLTGTSLLLSGPSRCDALSFATLTWLIGSALLSFYLANYAHYDATYGSLGAAIGLMIWMWMSAIVILLGAELNAQIEHQTTQDTTERSRCLLHSSEH